MESFDFVYLRSPLQSLKMAFEHNADKNLDALFDEGLYLSSPEFWQQLKKTSQLTSKEKKKVELTFLKYWLRSCSRCTPYGTFAGSLIVDLVDRDSELILSKSDAHRRSIRLDMSFVSLMIKSLEKLPIIQKQIDFFPNNSIYETHSSFRYAECFEKGDRRSYQLNSINNDDYVIHVLNNAKTGASISELSKLLSDMVNVTIEESADFILQMWQSQLLTSELESCITGKDPLRQLIHQLKKLKNITTILSSLESIQQAIDSFEGGANNYIEIEELLKDFDIIPDLPKNVIQTDLFLSARKNELNKKIIQNILNQVKELMVLSRKIKNSELDNFKAKFVEKFENQEMPLSLVLDADLGVGYGGVNEESMGGSPWINNLDVVRLQQTNIVNFDFIQKLALLKYDDYRKESKSQIEITDDDLKDFQKDFQIESFPNSMFLIGALRKDDSEQFNSENFLFDLNLLGGPSAGNLLGRFTYGDERLYHLTQEILRKEEENLPDAVFAEVAHLPEARVGNLLLRPTLRKYEIPYIGRSGVQNCDQILVEDLMVSIANNEIVLRSKQHNKRVIPRLTTAHNFRANSLPIYKFLCELQNQNLSVPMLWDWGNLEILDNLPRVIYKNIVIRKARWRINENSVLKWLGNENEYVSNFRTYRKDNVIPQRVSFKERDNVIIIDFEEQESIELLLQFIKKNKSLLIEEYLFTEKNCVVHDLDNDPFTDEVIIPFELYSNIKKTPLKNNFLSPSTRAKRKFPPFSEWLYFKIHCSPKTREKILKDNILPFVENGLLHNDFEKFFFIRYKDSSQHLRIRFYNSNISKQAQLSSNFISLFDHLLKAGLIEKIELDTYIRENERYKDELIEETESLFYNDSLAILRFINLLENDENENYRIIFGLRSLDLLLNDFKLTLLEKREIMKTKSTLFVKEFGNSLFLQKQLNKKFKENQSLFFSHLNKEMDSTNEIEDGVEVFETRSQMNAKVVEEILRKISGNDLNSEFYNLLSSYIHLSINRLFVNHQRQYELVICHFLERYYTSKLAILEKNDTR